MLSLKYSLRVGYKRLVVGSCLNCVYKTTVRIQRAVLRIVSTHPLCTLFFVQQKRELVFDVRNRPRSSENTKN